MNTPLTLKKIEDRTLMYKKRIDFFKQNKDQVLYNLAVQQYKDWLIKIKESEVTGVNYFKLQLEYRKYFGIRGDNSFKLIIKDIVGYVNLSMLSKFKLICKKLKV